MMKENTALFICSQRLKQLLMRGILIIYLNQSIVRLYQTNKKYLVKGSNWIIDSVLDHSINISKYKPLTGSSYIKLPNN